MIFELFIREECSIYEAWCHPLLAFYGRKKVFVDGMKNDLILSKKKGSLMAAPTPSLVSWILKSFAKTKCILRLRCLVLVYHGHGRCQRGWWIWCWLSILRYQSGSDDWNVYRQAADFPFYPFFCSFDSFTLVECCNNSIDSLHGNEGYGSSNSLHPLAVSLWWNYVVGSLFLPSWPLNLLLLPKVLTIAEYCKIYTGSMPGKQMSMMLIWTWFNLEKRHRRRTDIMREAVMGVDEPAVVRGDAVAGMLLSG